jgi:hypothetical protein
MNKMRLMVKLKFTLGRPWIPRLLGLISLINPVATGDKVIWAQVNLPSEGESGYRVLPSGSDIQHWTMVIDCMFFI